jgi:16S rRNA (uracil1498-N3)-methyltransferase
MHRFYLAPGDSVGENLTLAGSEAHHAVHVLRLRRGEQLILLDGAGVERICEVTQTAKSGINLHVLQKRNIPPLPYQLTLVQAIPKGKLLESTIQKATELGVSRVVPLLTERVVTHLEGADVLQKARKWQGVALEAIKQCGSAWLPQVDAPLNIPQFLQQQNKFELNLVGSLQPGSIHPRVHLSEFQQIHQRHPSSVCVWIGPEGDFTSEELAAIQSAGALPITLGRLVLRTETAALYCLSFLAYELQSPLPCHR